MQQHILKIRKQLLIPFVLLELLAITSTGANVIRKEFAVVEPTTEGSAESTTLQQTALPIKTSTSSVIAKITSNDILRQNQRSPESTTLFESQTTEGNVEIFKAAQETTVQATTNLSDTDDSKITTKSPNEETTAATAEIPTTKENANSEGDKENREISSDKVATTDVATEGVPITTESEEFNVRTRVSPDDVTTKRIAESIHTLKNESAQAIEQHTTESSQETTDERTTVSPQLPSTPSTHSTIGPTTSTTRSTSSTTQSTYSTSISKTSGNAPEITTDHTFINNKLSAATEGDKNGSVTANEVVVEGVSYDITTNEIRNLSSIRTTEKRPKQMKNMTLPDSPEVWALAGMRKSEKTKDKDQKFVNITDENALESASSTTATKLLSDWSKIMNEVELNKNHAQSSPNSIENTLESSVNKPDASEPKLQFQKIEKDNDINSPSTVASISTENPPTSKPISATTKTTYGEATPSIEKNQVEYIEINHSKDKEIKETDSAVSVGGRTGINTTIPPLTTAVINILKKITSTTPISTRQTIGVLTEKPLHVDDIETIKHFSTSSQLANLIDSSSVTTSIPKKQSIDDQTLTTVQPSTKANWFQNETTTVQKILVTTDSSPEVISSTSESATTSTDYSTPTETFSDTSSSSSSYSAQVTSEPSTTEDSDAFSSETSDFSQTSTTISTQLRPTLGNDIRTSPASEDYYSWASSSEAPVSTTRANPTSEQPTENNVIDRITEDATIGLDQFTSETSKMSTTTFISSPSYFDDSVKSINETEEISTTTTVFQNTPGGDQEVYSETPKNFIIPVMPTTTATKIEVEPPTSTTEASEVGGPIPSENNNVSSDTDYNVIIAISVSVVGILALILLVGFLYVMRKRQKNLTYGQRCRPVSLDAYSLDNVSIYNSVRRKGALRASKRSYGNVAFDDPSLKHNVLGIHDLAKFVDRKTTIHEEFKDVPQITTRPDEVPPGCEDKNRYANVIPLPETRVILEQLNGDERTEYINANFVRGPKDPPNYYIACQAPLESTVADFWRMLWEQNSRVVIMATDLVENGKEKCVEYLPPSITIDNHVVFGDFQITLKNREVKEKYAVSTLHVKNNTTNTWREINHFWYQWPESGVPGDEAGVIAMLLEARSCLKMPTQEQIDEEESKTNGNGNGNLPEPNGNVDKTKILSKSQGPLTVHCSPGTGRTGTIIACDIALRSLETPKRSVDIPQIVYYVRRGRASAVQTKEQYEFIYRVAHMYATKISGPVAET